MMSVLANFADICLRGMREKCAKRDGIGTRNHCRLTAFLRSIYLIYLDQFSPAILTLCREKNNVNFPPFFW